MFRRESCKAFRQLSLLVSEMAFQSRPVAPEELARAQEVISRAQHAGVKSRKNSDQGYAAMNDGCKRLRAQGLEDLYSLG